MPELPDVEGFRRVASAALGRRISSIEVPDTGVLRNANLRTLSRALVGAEIREAERRGKWLILWTSGPALVLHFGMTGQLLWQPDPEPDPYDRAAFITGDGRLVYRDIRKLQGLWLADDPAGVNEIVGPLGPDAYGITAAQLDRALAGHRRGLKAALMDQAVVAGLGNMSVDEILWRTPVHPTVTYDELTVEERRALHQAVGAVLRPAVKAGSIPRRRGWLSSQRDRPDPHCPRCGGSLDRLRVGGRGTLVCPSCQRRPRPARPAQHAG